MNAKCYVLILIGLMSFACHTQTYAQEGTLLPPIISTSDFENKQSEQDPVNPENLILSEEDLSKIIDIQKQFEKQNKTYKISVNPSENLLRFLHKDELQISEEALYWARLVRDVSTIIDENMTFRDTMIVNPLFMPILFRGDYLPHNLVFYNPDTLKTTTPYERLATPEQLFEDEKRNIELERSAYKYVQNSFPTYFRYSINDLPQEIIKPKTIKRQIDDKILFQVKADTTLNSNPDELPRFIPERRYWTSAFESTIQLSESYVSKNWSGGGNSNLNMLTRQYVMYNYEKDKIKFTNELEIKLNMNAIPSQIDTVHSYLVNDDLFRITSNFGFKAREKWYYTFNFEFKTQLVNNYAPNSEQLRAAFLAPMSINVGPGMKYELNKSDFKTRHRSVTFNVNMQPVTYNFMYSTKSDANMDLGRHNFKLKKGEVAEGENPYENVLHQIGSRAETNLTFNINRNISWTSKMIYFTTYEMVNWDFENTFNLQISRFFSTRINLHVRYNDGVAKSEDFKSYFQFNQLLSFGFNYKW